METYICFMFLFVLLSLDVASVATRTSLDTTSSGRPNKFLERLKAANEEATKNDSAWREHLKLFQGHDDQRLKSAGGFNCTILPPSPQVPTSVHALRPGDVKVMGAMGDSLSAGFGMMARTPAGMLTEWRGRVWSIGGDASLDTIVTLPNFFRKYNPDVVGFATGKGKVSSPGAHLDVSVSGDMAEDMPSQAIKLVGRIENMKNVDFNLDWKMVTIFIGANDLCAYIKDKLYYSPQNYYNYLKEALETLRTMPRTFVNLVEVLEATMVHELDIGPICKAYHSVECPDYASGNQDNIAAGRRVRKQYQKMVESLAGEYEDLENFTVVQQPFFKNMVPPKHEHGIFKGSADLSFFAPDCFHFSGKADAAAAEALWNNVFERVHEKRTSWRVGEKLVCPTSDDPYLKTVRNSAASRWKKEWNQEKPEDYETYPMTNTGHALTWGFVSVLVGIAIVAALVYVIKTKYGAEADSERSGLLPLENDDSPRGSRWRFGRKDRGSSDVAMERLEGHVA